MFSKLRSFVYRHRRKFIVTGIIVASGFVLPKYAKKCIREWQTNQTKEFLERREKQQHYESVERTCNQVALTLIPSIKESVCALHNTDVLIKNVKEAGNKLTTFEELKIVAFSKVVLLIYITSLLMVTLRLQVNLIGGYMFKSTTDESAIVVNNNIQEKYLSLTEYLIKTGINKLSKLVREKVELVLKNRSLKEMLTLTDVEQIFWSIHNAINNDSQNPCTNLPFFVLPHEDNVIEESGEDSIYHKIMSETRDVLESDEVMSLTDSCVSRGFSYFVDSFADYFVDRTQIVSKPSTSNAEPFFQENLNTPTTTTPNFISIPMARVIPIINVSVSNRGSTSDTSHTWSQQLILMNNLKNFGANVYECFSV